MENDLFAEAKGVYIKAHKSSKLAKAYLSTRLRVWDITKAMKMNVVFMLFSLYASNVLAVVTRNDKEEIFVADIERTFVA